MNLFCRFGFLATVDRSANNAVINVAITVANLIVSLVVSKMLVTKHQPPDKKTS